MVTPVNAPVTPLEFGEMLQQMELVRQRDMREHMAQLQLSQIDMQRQIQEQQVEVQRQILQLQEREEQRRRERSSSSSSRHSEGRRRRPGGGGDRRHVAQHQRLPPPIKIPKFKGEHDPNAYIEWEQKVDQVFSIHMLVSKNK